MFLFRLINTIILVCELVLIARVVFSWLPPESRQNQFFAFIYDATEPILAPVRRYVPTFYGIDFSPLIVFIGLHILRSIIL